MVFLVPESTDDNLTIMRQIISRLGTYRIKELQLILRIAKLSITGRKATLAERAESYVRDLEYLRDREGLETFLAITEQLSKGMTADLPRATPAMSFTDTVNSLNWQDERMRAMPEPPVRAAAPASRSEPHQSVATRPVAGQTVASQLRAHPAQLGQTQQGTVLSPPVNVSPKLLKFKTSPFYRLLRQEHAPFFFQKPHMRERLQRSISFKVNCNQFTGGQKLFLMCQELTLNPDYPAPIYFPYNNEIYVNGVHVPANTRGVKGRPGSARPVDITPQLVGRDGNNSSGAKRDQQLTIGIHVSMRDPSLDDNTLRRSFAFGLFSGVSVPITEILANIKARPMISKNIVQTRIREHFAAEEDLGTEEAVYSLMDQVALCRIQTPIRSTLCSHVECFDAEAFLQLQEQAETWRCPNCDKDITFGSLAVDEYFSEVIKEAAPDARQIVVDKEGVWSFRKEESDPETDSDDEPPRRPFKRLRRAPEVTVIDLTNSDDEEQPPQPQPQQQLALPAPPTRPTPPLFQSSSQVPSREPLQPPSVALTIPPRTALVSQGDQTRTTNGNSATSNGTPSPYSSATERALTRVIGAPPQSPQGNQLGEPSQAVTPQPNQERPPPRQPTPVLSRAAALARSQLQSQPSQARSTIQRPSGVSASSPEQSQNRQLVHMSPPGRFERRLSIDEPGRGSNGSVTSPDLFQPHSPERQAAGQSPLQLPQNMRLDMAASQRLQLAPAPNSVRNVPESSGGDELGHFRMTFSRAKSALFGAISNRNTTPANTTGQKLSGTSESTENRKNSQSSVVQRSARAEPPPSFQGDIIDLTNDDD